MILIKEISISKFIFSPEMFNIFERNIVSKDIGFIIICHDTPLQLFSVNISLIQIQHTEKEEKKEKTKMRKLFSN